MLKINFPFLQKPKKDFWVSTLQEVQGVQVFPWYRTKQPVAVM